MGKIKQYAQSIYQVEPTTMDEVAFSVIKIINHFKEPLCAEQKIQKQVKCLGFSWNLVHSEQVSNSHSSPEGYPTNWGIGRPDLPRSYSGWSGRVWIRYAERLPWFSKDTFDMTLTHTGTGGFGGYYGPWDNLAQLHFNRYGLDKLDKIDYPRPEVFSWDYKIFDADWPQVNAIKQHEYLACLKKFEGLPVPDLSHHFLWEDLETKAKDKAFILDCVGRRKKP
jgi:hypothetical protein